MPETNRQPEEQELEQTFGKVLAAWDFPEYEPYERGRRWYLISALIVILLLIYSYYDENPLLAIIIILTALTFIVSERRGPEYHELTITEDGVIVGQLFYEYEDLKNFFIIYTPPEVKTLYIEPKSYIKPRLAIPLQDQDPSVIRKILLKYIPEDLEKEHEPVSDSWGRLLKF